jgi:hypothetical protein
MPTWWVGTEMQRRAYRPLARDISLVTNANAYHLVALGVPERVIETTVSGADGWLNVAKRELRILGQAHS